MVTCKYCSKEIPISTAWKEKPTSRTYFCNENCFLLLNEDKKNTKAHSTKSGIGSDRRILTDYVQLLFIRAGFDKHNIDWSTLMRSCNNILKEHLEWDFITILYVLRYMVEIEQIDLITPESYYNPFALVEFYAKKAENYWTDMNRLECSLEGVDFKDDVKVIKLSHKKRRFGKEISFEDL